MNEGSGTTTADRSGHGLTGTRAGSPPPSWVAGRGGYQLSFNGSTASVDVGRSSLLSITGAITLATCVAPSNMRGARDVISNSDAAGANAQYRLRLSHANAGDLAFVITNGGVSRVIVSAGGVVPLNTPSHVGATWDGSSVGHLYVNGL